MTITPTAQGDALRRACRDLGLGDAVADQLLARLLEPTPVTHNDIDPVAHQAMAHREAEIMRLLNTAKPEKLIHDLRNLLNEVALLKAAADL